MSDLYYCQKIESLEKEVRELKEELYRCIQIIEMEYCENYREVLEKYL